MWHEQWYGVDIQVNKYLMNLAKHGYEPYYLYKTPHMSLQTVPYVTMNYTISILNYRPLSKNY